MTDTPTPTRRKGLTKGTCAACGHTFVFETVKGKQPPDLCGFLACTATRWTPEQWEGRARMAAARRDTGAPLDPLDHQALAKHPTPTVLARPPGWPPPQPRP